VSVCRVCPCPVAWGGLPQPAVHDSKEVPARARRQPGPNSQSQSIPISIQNHPRPISSPSPVQGPVDTSQSPSPVLDPVPVGSQSVPSQVGPIFPFPAANQSSPPVPASAPGCPLPSASRPRLPPSPLLASAVPPLLLLQLTAQAPLLLPAFSRHSLGLLPASYYQPRAPTAANPTCYLPCTHTPPPLPSLSNLVVNSIGRRRLHPPLSSPSRVHSFLRLFAFPSLSFSFFAADGRTPSQRPFRRRLLPKGPRLPVFPSRRSQITPSPPFASERPLPR
jgi:hypothetical protein